MNEELHTLFKKFDQDHDGLLTYQDILIGYTSIFGSEERALFEVDLLYKRIGKTVTDGVAKINF